MTEKTTGREGETVGPYRLDALLGRGGMGEVYRAHDTTRDRTVALKLLPGHLAQDPAFIERFRRECQTVARLDEPHVIPIHDFGEIDGQLFLDMRLVNGSDLRTVMRERGALEPAEAVGLLEQVAAALDAAHAADLVHRDVKPENILVTTADFAYLVDFGVAHADTDTHLTKTGTAVGSVAYMAPEQFDDSPVTAVTDVYALAAVFFEMLTGAKPYPGSSVSTITKGLLFDPIPAASTVNPALTEAMDQVLAWGLAKDPTQRCPSALELARAARAALSGERPPTVGESETGLIAAAGAAPTTVHRTEPAAPAEAAYAAVEAPASAPPPPGAYGMQPPPGQPYPQQHYGQQPYGQPYPTYGPPPAKSNGLNTALIAVLSVIVVALIGVGVWYLLDQRSTDTETVAATSTVVITPPTAAPTTVEATTSAPTAAWTPGPPPSDNQPCPGFPGVGTGYPQWTGCEFAANVRTAYLESGPMGGTRAVNGWAPQQRMNYVMNCGPYQQVIACRGGNQAVVYIY
ncbi:serine/threonine-protein kinase [Gordonia alkaliphila]|uniref:non-specific serine/threonine protein kinase n=1 Tax=Gordonia alkaliphila TaxID=1053547 RepID=A0ABP8Z3Y8_9ACTN